MSPAPAISDPDADLLPALARGDEAALTTLMERRLDGLHRLCFRLLGDTHEAEDVCQESFLKLWQAAPTWQPGRARLMTWLCRVATNRCYDRLRKKRPDLPGDTLNPADDRITVEARLIRDERWDALQTAMMALKPRERTALALCYDDALPQKDAATAMEITVSAYESLLVRARKSLRAELDMERQSA